jgi:hypothetical protein
VKMKQTVEFELFIFVGSLLLKVTKPSGGALLSTPLSTSGVISFEPSRKSTPKLSLGLVADAPLPFELA